MKKPLDEDLIWSISLALVALIMFGMLAFRDINRRINHPVGFLCFFGQHEYQIQKEYTDFAHWDSRKWVTYECRSVKCLHCEKVLHEWLQSFQTTDRLVIIKNFRKYNGEKLK